MPRVKSEKQINSFIKGIVTEANPLTYPENASIDEANFVLKRDGSRERRLGIDYESNYALTDTGLTSVNMESTAVQFFQWDKAGGTKTIGIVRVYNKLWFLDLEKANPSAYKLNGGSAITLGITNSALDFALSTNGIVLVAEELPSPIYFEYNTTTDTVTQSTVPVQVRDLWGIDDNLTASERPTTLSETHHYNLKNQGWIDDIQNVCATGGPIECTYEKLEWYPSNSDIWSLGKSANSSSPSTFEKYDPEKLQKNSYDFAFSSRGKYILDAFNRGSSRNTESSITGLPLDKENGSITTAAAFASRLFYSGIESNTTSGDKRSPNYSSYIFFTQIIKSKEELGKCYQEADPTSDAISDIVDTDGGFIQINEAAQILKLLPTKTSLLVFATNGIWEIYAGDSGFKATEYQVNKVTDIGVSNPRSIVLTEGAVIYWANGGIYLLQPDNVTGRFVPQNLSLTTIQTLFNDLPQAAKSNATGFFDEKEHVVRWLYNDDSTYDGVNFKYKYNKELVMDLTLQAFYISTISSNASNSPYIASYMSIPNYVSRDQEEQIVVGSDEVQAGGVDVVVTVDAQEPRGVSLKYLTIKPGTTYSFTVSEYKDNSFVDWKTDNGTGTSFTSYLITGQELFGDLLRTKQVPYIQFFFRRTEDGFDSNTELEHQSSCLVQARWGFSDSANSGKWGTQFQAYRFRRNYIPSGPADTFDYGESVIVTKNKLRGSGKAVSLYITSEAGKDMKLLGWALEMSGNSQG